MQFNKNIFKRLYNIACFIPEITARDDWEQQEMFQATLELAEAKLPSSIKERYKLRSSQPIKVMEVKLFLLCIRAYENLQEVFSEFEDSFPGPESYVDAPIGFYTHIVSQKDLSKQLIEEKSFGMFRGVRNCVRFYCNFFDSYGIYRCFRSMIPALEKLNFLSDLRDHLYSCMEYAARFDKGLMAALLDLAALLDRYNQCGDGSPDRENILQSLIRVYGEIWFYAHSIALPNVFKPKEIERRNAISKTKLDNNSHDQQQVEFHLQMIKAHARNLSSRKACINYFTEHKDELEMLNIRSYRTLQNRLLKTDPNKQRKRFNNSYRIVPNYPYSFESSVNEMWKKTK